VDQWVTTSDANQAQVGTPYRSLTSAHLVAEVSVSKERVSEPSASLAPCLDALSDIPRPAHPSDCLVAQLNANWRVVDDPLQWILQRRKGKPRTRNSGWRGRSFCRTKDALLGCIGNHCGEVDAEALSKLKSLPDWHADWATELGARTWTFTERTKHTPMSGRTLGLSEIGGLLG
jgi:hypothetical protein